MDPVIAKRTLVGRSQFTLATDADCILTDLSIDGGKLLRATIGAAHEPVELLDEKGKCVTGQWPDGWPITVEAEPDKPGDEVTVTAAREAQKAPAAKKSRPKK